MTFSTEIKGGAKLVRFALVVLCVLLLFKNTHTVFFLLLFAIQNRKKYCSEKDSQIRYLKLSLQNI